MTTMTDAASPSAYGEVFTRRWVVDVLLDLVGYTPDRDLGALTLVEPSAGSGAFLLPAIERLLESARGHGRSPEQLGQSVRAFELQHGNVDTCRALVASHLQSRGIDEVLAHSLAISWVSQADFLLGSDTEPWADFVVGNPPYIRSDDVPTRVATRYRTKWTTMAGRADIYVGFFQRSLRLLRPGGRVGFICADRWMRNQYGAGLRRLVSADFAVEQVWTMHDVDAFHDQVSAYPAITVFSTHQQGRVVAADARAAFGGCEAQDLASWALETDSSDTYRTPAVSAHRLPHWFAGDQSWPTGPPGRLRLIEHMNDSFAPLQDTATGTKVGIGVASGSDRVFVTPRRVDIEEDRLLSLSTRRDLSTGHYTWSGRYLVNPWDCDGRLVPLDGYPKLRAYLLGVAAPLRDRYVARKTPTAWYRTIDKVDHDLIAKPKILIPDMSMAINPVLEPGGHYPHHNLYHVTSTRWDMEVLGGLLLSRVAQAFIEAYCVRMRGGTLRFQAQYLRRIRVPDPAMISPNTADALRQAFRARDVHSATQAAADAYNINLEEYDLV